MAGAGYDYLYIMGFYFPKARIGQYVIAGDSPNRVARAAGDTLETAPNPFESFSSAAWPSAGLDFQG